MLSQRAGSVNSFTRNREAQQSPASQQSFAGVVDRGPCHQILGSRAGVPFGDHLGAHDVDSHDVCAHNVGAADIATVILPLRPAFNVTGMTTGAVPASGNRKRRQ